MELTSEQIESNLDLHYKIIDHYITGERKDKVLNLIKNIIGEVEYALCPASGTDWYHGCYAGGYIVHVNSVVKTALKICKMYESFEGNIDFTEEELVFSALFHDLGKLGNGDKINYIPNPSEWHRKNQGKIYISNPELDFMLVPDRSLFLLQKAGIVLTQKEYLAIKLHDGVFDESNKAYYVSYSPDSKLKTNLVPILHAADYLSAKIEFDIEHKEA